MGRGKQGLLGVVEEDLDPLRGGVRLHDDSRTAGIDQRPEVLGLAVGIIEQCGNRFADGL
jgi:hypothetical protein